MATKRVSFDFFTVHFGPGTNEDKFDKKLTLENSKQIKSEIEVFNYLLRIGSLKKVKKNQSFPSMDDNYLWVGAIERINVSDEAYAGKKGVPGRSTFASGDDEGPLKDTVFLYDPKTGVLILERSRGGLYHANMTNYISSLCHDENVILKIMVDSKVLTKLEKLPVINSIEYSISTPNPSSLSNNGRAVHGDINLLNLLNGNKLNIVIGTDKDNYLKKANALTKVKDLLSSKESISRLVVKGTNNSDLEILDLIKERIEASKKVNAGAGKKVSFVHVMDTIVDVYRDKENLIKDYTK